MITGISLKNRLQSIVILSVVFLNSCSIIKEEWVYGYTDSRTIEHLTIYQAFKHYTVCEGNGPAGEDCSNSNYHTNLVVVQNGEIKCDPSLVIHVEESATSNWYAYGGLFLNHSIFLVQNLEPSINEFEIIDFSKNLFSKQKIKLSINSDENLLTGIDLISNDEEINHLEVTYRELNSGEFHKYIYNLEEKKQEKIEGSFDSLDDEFLSPGWNTSDEFKNCF